MYINYVFPSIDNFFLGYWFIRQLLKNYFETSEIAGVITLVLALYLTGMDLGRAATDRTKLKSLVVTFTSATPMRHACPH